MQNACSQGTHLRHPACINRNVQTYNEMLRGLSGSSRIQHIPRCPLIGPNLPQPLPWRHETLSITLMSNVVVRTPARRGNQLRYRGGVLNVDLLKLALVAFRATRTMGAHMPIETLE